MIIKKDKENYWDSEDYFKIGGDIKHTVMHPELIKIAGNLQGKKALDFGCGDGILSVRLANAGADVLGVDTSDAAIQRAKKLYTNRNLRFEHIVSFDDSLIAESSPFDVIILCMVLNTLSDSKSVINLLKIMSGFSAPGGQLLIAVTHPLSRGSMFSTYCCGLKPEHYRIESASFPVE
ncbi:MAG: methyltransferase domain-containing protein, partial [Desulfobacula sp.]|nr:methyltransferase domain-containing protein [Desulfobacula sp.]